jgi:hypothetical protein
LLQLYSFYGDDFRVECPTDSGRFMTLFEVSTLLFFLGDLTPEDAQRDLGCIFLRLATRSG